MIGIKSFEQMKEDYAEREAYREAINDIATKNKIRNEIKSIMTRLLEIETEYPVTSEFDSFEDVIVALEKVNDEIDLHYDIQSNFIEYYESKSEGDYEQH